MLAMHLKVIVLGFGPVLGNRAPLDESSVLHMTRLDHPSQAEEASGVLPPHSQLEEASECIGGACAKPAKKPSVPVNPNARCDGVDCQKVCDGAVLTFSEDRLAENTLYRSGYSGGGTMKITDVAPGVDMYITDAKGNYDRSSTKYHKKHANGEFIEQNNGMYAKSGIVHDVIRIAMEKAQDYEFKFQLKNKQGEPATLDEFPLVFYDMDYYESVKACGVSGAVADEQTDLQSTWDGDCVTFKAGYKSAESPDNFDEPTRDQAKASASFIYEKTSEWKMTFALKYYSHRWVLFKSSKALSCATNGGD
jgi:hypothetical protein